MLYPSITEELGIIVFLMQGIEQHQTFYFNGQKISIAMADEASDDVLYEASLFEPIRRCSVLSYGVGHMLNDITSACWFTYLLLFLTDIGLSPRYLTY